MAERKLKTFQGLDHHLAQMERHERKKNQQTGAQVKNKTGVK